MRRRSEGAKVGRPPKLTPADELAIFEARRVDVSWKDLMAQFGVSRSVLAEAYNRAKVRISGHNSGISGHIDAGHKSPA